MKLHCEICHKTYPDKGEPVGEGQVGAITCVWIDKLGKMKCRCPEHEKVENGL